MTRVDDWPTKLLAEIDRHVDTAFEWGVEDCLTFPADCVKVITGEDFMAPYRGTYRNLEEAKTVLQEAGFESYADALASRYPAIPVAMAGRGDLGVIEGDMANTCVVFVDEAIGKDFNGLRRVSRFLVTKAFKVL
jgi:hypothetical protein